MKIRIVSDLHFEFREDAGETMASEVTSRGESGFDVLVVAGDLSSSPLLAHAVSLLAGKTKKPIVYVPGNHEFYKSNREKVMRTLRGMGRLFSHFHVLDNEILELDGVRFLGTPLWFRRPTARSWDFSKLDAKCSRCEAPLEVVGAVDVGAQLRCPTCAVLFLYDVSKGMNDFAAIENFASWVYRENTEALEFLREELSDLDVVVTHYLPAKKSIHPMYEGEISNPYFLCDVEELIRSRKPTLWIHGHTHKSRDYRIEDTRVVCNPFGYVAQEENEDFDSTLTVEVDSG